MPAVLYNYIGNRTKFWFVCWFGLVAFVLTLVFVPDTTGLDLREQDRYWQYVIEGRIHEYHGVAICPRHLSLWERVVLKRHLNYDPEADRADKLRELKALYEGKRGEAVAEDEKRFLANDLGGFFASEDKLCGGLSSTTPKHHDSRLAVLERKLA